MSAGYSTSCAPSASAKPRNWASNQRRNLSGVPVRIARPSCRSWIPSNSVVVARLMGEETPGDGFDGSKMLHHHLAVEQLATALHFDEGNELENLQGIEHTGFEQRGLRVHLRGRLAQQFLVHEIQQVVHEAANASEPIVEGPIRCFTTSG